MIELSVDEELNKQMNTPVNVQDIKDEYDKLYDTISVWGRNISDQFENLSSQTQQMV